jgi:hypothetical protein
MVSDGKRSSNELAEGAVVFLVNARTVGCAVLFDVRLYRRTSRVAERIRVRDAGDARQERLCNSRDDDPQSESPGKPSTHYAHARWYWWRI